MTTKVDSTMPHLLRNEKEYDAAVAEIDALLDANPEPGSAEADRVEVLSLLVEDYDKKHFAFGASHTPQSVVEFALEQQSKTRADLVPIFGSKSRVSEFFSGKRRLSLNQIAALKKKYGIPSDLLVASDSDVDEMLPVKAGGGQSQIIATLLVSMTRLVESHQSMVHELRTQFSLQTAVLTKALSMLGQVSAAYQSAVQMPAAANNPVVEPDKGLLTGTINANATITSFPLSRKILPQ